MKSEIKYLKYLLRHKWYVMIECFKLGLIWQGLTHDSSKFYPDEFFPYAHFFYAKNGSINKSTQNKNGYCKPIDTGNEDFDLAWQKHIKRNKHHLQWWIQNTDNEEEKLLPMKEPYLSELLCDWIGAGKAQGHTSPKDDPYLNVRNWYIQNKENIRCADETRKNIEQRIGLSATF